jgi:hypothetical protein
MATRPTLPLWFVRYHYPDDISATGINLLAIRSEQATINNIQEKLCDLNALDWI